MFQKYFLFEQNKQYSKNNIQEDNRELEMQGEDAGILKIFKGIKGFFEEDIE